MEVSTSKRQAYSEIDEFLSLITEEERNKVPDKLREFFKAEKDTEYIKGIDPKIPIKDQNLKTETLAIIAMLNLKYWCEDEKEKERLKVIYKENERINNELLQKGTGEGDVFKVREKPEQKEETTVSIQKYKEPFLKGLLIRIKKIFVKK